MQRYSLRWRFMHELEVRCSGQERRETYGHATHLSLPHVRVEALRALVPLCWLPPMLQIAAMHELEAGLTKAKSMLHSLLAAGLRP